MEERFVGIPAEFYKYKTGDQQIQAEGDERWGLDKLDVTDDGVYVYITNAQFPYKNFVYANPENQNTLFAANQVKSLFIETIKSFPIWMLLLSNKQKLLDGFNRIAFRIASPHILKDKQWSRFAKTFHYVVFTFLYELGFEEKSCDTFAEILVWIIDCDNAYRLRLEDIFNSVARRDLVEQPKETFDRMMNIYLERETNISVSNKFKKLGKLLSYLLYIPKYKKAFSKAFDGIEYWNLQLDEADTYWTIIRKDYNFMGMNVEQRKEYAESKNFVMPKSI
jgi:hypothetical protein